MSLQEIMSYLTVFTVGILVGYVLKVVLDNINAKEEQQSKQE